MERERRIFHSVDVSVDEDVYMANDVQDGILIHKTANVPIGGSNGNSTEITDSRISMVLRTSSSSRSQIK